jgi:hypothetical protein
MIVDNAPNCLKYEITGLAGPIVPNPILLTRFCNASDMGDRIMALNRSTMYKADGFYNVYLVD